MAEYTRETFTLVLSSSGHPQKNDFNTNLYTSIRLDPKYKSYISLLSCGISKSWYNISPALGNNTYLYNGGERSLSAGLWSIDALSAEIESQTGGNIILSSDSTIGRVVITIQGGGRIFFNDKLSVMLGFTPGVLIASSEIAPNPANIDNINMVNVNCSLVDGKYSHVNTKQTQTIYSIPPRGDVGNFEQFDGVSYVGSFYQLSQNDISEVRMWLTDQDGNRLIYDSEVTYVLQIITKPLQQV